MRKPCPDEHAFRGVLAPVDGRPERVELSELRAVLVRDQELHRLEALLEVLRHAGADLVQPFPREGRHLERVGEARREPSAPQRIERVDLVQHELSRKLPGADLR